MEEVSGFSRAVKQRLLKNIVQYPILRIGLFIKNTIMLFVRPTKVCISILFNFKSQEK